MKNYFVDFFCNTSFKQDNFLSHQCGKRELSSVSELIISGSVSEMAQQLDKKYFISFWKMSHLHNLFLLRLLALFVVYIHTW